MYEKTPACDLFPNIINQCEQCLKHRHMPNERFCIEIDFSGFSTPYVDLASKKVRINNFFMAYLWCLTYSLVVCTESIMMHALENGGNREGYEWDGKLPDNTIFADAQKMFGIAMEFIKNHNLWTQKDPNPSYEKNSVLKDIEDTSYWCRKVNSVFIDSVVMLLIHEITHLEKRHKPYSQNLTGEESIESINQEREADEAGIDYCETYGLNASSKDPNIKYLPAILPFLAMIFLPNALKAQKTHPDVDSRLNQVLCKYNDLYLDKETSWIDYLISIALVSALKNQHNKVMPLKHQTAREAIECYRVAIQSSIDASR